VIERNGVGSAEDSTVVSSAARGVERDDFKGMVLEGELAVGAALAARQFAKGMVLEEETGDLTPR